MIANNDNIHVTNRVIATAHTSATHSNHSFVSGQEVPSLQQSLSLADDVTNTRARLGITVQAELHQHAQLFRMPVLRWPPQLVAASTNITLLSTSFTS